MTDQENSQSLPDNLSSSSRELLVQISLRVEDTQRSVKSLEGRVQSLENSIDSKVSERERLIKTDLEAKILTEAQERRIQETYYKARYERYDDEIKEIKMGQKESQTRTESEFRDVRAILRANLTEHQQRFDMLQTKVDSTSDNIAALQTKMSLIIGVIVVVSELVIKILPELVK